jgi:hypothetical protein
MFSDGLSAAMEKVEEYYDKTATSHAYTFVMCACSSLLFNIHGLNFVIVLDPEMKMSHFEKHWSKPLQDKVSESAEAIVCSFHYPHASLLIFYSFKNGIRNYMVKMAHQRLLPASRKKTRSSLVYSPKIQQMMRWTLHRLQQLHLLTLIPKNRGYVNSGNTLMEPMKFQLE